MFTAAGLVGVFLVTMFASFVVLNVLSEHPEKQLSSMLFWSLLFALGCTLIASNF